MGTVFNIQRMCVHDGPGIRSTVFLKGCPLDCLWCHNPESKSTRRQLAFYEDRCTGCGRCVSVCDNHFFEEKIHKIRRDSCAFCGKCVETCLNSALEIIGEEKTAEQVLEVVLRDRDFYEISGGGVTLSGGEPLSQPGFALELLRAFKEKKLHTCVETSGFASRKTMEAAAEYTDLFLYDIKETDEQRHIRFTGRSNRQILDNLFYLDSVGAGIVLRCPIIPTCNAEDRHYLGIAELAGKLKHLREINIMGYHTLGVSKARTIGRTYPLEGVEALPEEEKQKCIQMLRERVSCPVR